MCFVPPLALILVLVAEDTDPPFHLHHFVNHLPFGDSLGSDFPDWRLRRTASATDALLRSSIPLFIKRHVLSPLCSFQADCYLGHR